jgi:hypothetical protein
MSLELFNSLATFGTFLVIAATAIAALVQLRHARSANLIEGLSEVRRTFTSADFQAAQQFVLAELPKKWQEPEFRYQQITRSARTPENQVLISKINQVGNTYENVGLLVKRQLIDGIMALDLYSGNAIGAWESLAPLTVAMRRRAGNALWENFEYFFVLAQDWQAAHPNGTYPPGVRRIALADELREADAQYAASRATA